MSEGRYTISSSDCQKESIKNQITRGRENLNESFLGRIFPHLSFTLGLRFLVLNIALGLTLTGIVAYSALYGIKQDFDILFKSHTTSLAALEEIKGYYAGDLQEVFKMLSNNAINNKNAKLELERVHNDINMLWRNYLDVREKSDEMRMITVLRKLRKQFFIEISEPLESIEHERQLISEIEMLMTRERGLSHEAEILFKLNRAQAAINKVKNELLPHTEKLQKKLSILIHHKLDQASINKRSTDALYASTLKLIVIMIAIITLITLILSALIINTLEILHNTLEENVEEKTKELQILNKSLERCIACEVTESRKKDQIMYQQARLASMGEMIQNIAHQWRQPLNALIMLIQSFKSKSDNGKLDSDFVEIQVREGLRIAKKMSDTIEDFRGFFRPNKDEESFSLRDSIQDSAKLVEAFYRQSEIELLICINDDIEVLGYKNAFSQVILNIIKNAEDVLLERAILPKLIRIDMERIDDDGVDCAMVSIVDNGGGIQLENIEKVFEPYFTTKHKSVGTGIGLYMSKQIIEKQMNGRIEVVNRLWKHDKNNTAYTGAMFIITIPTNKSTQKEQL